MTIFRDVRDREHKLRSATEMENTIKEYCHESKRGGANLNP